MEANYLARSETVRKGFKQNSREPNKFKAGISTGCSIYVIFLSISSVGLVEIFSCCHLGSRFTSYRPLDYQKPKNAFNVLRFTEAIIYSEQVFERMTRCSQDQLTDVK